MRTAQCHFYSYAVTLWRSCVDLQEDKPVKKAVVEQHEADIYRDLYDDLSVSTVTVGPNVTDYEVG